jgi:hypothetical protein
LEVGDRIFRGNDKVLKRMGNVLSGRACFSSEKSSAAQQRRVQVNAKLEQPDPETV